MHILLASVVEGLVIVCRRKLEAGIKVPGLIVKGLTEAGAVQSEVERDAILGKGRVVQIEQEGHE